MNIFEWESPVSDQVDYDIAEFREDDLYEYPDCELEAFDDISDLFEAE